MSRLQQRQEIILKSSSFFSFDSTFYPSADVERKRFSVLGLIISNNNLAAVSTFPELWAHLYHNPLICLTMGDHRSCWNVCEIRSKNLPVSIDQKRRKERNRWHTSLPDRIVEMCSMSLLYGTLPVEQLLHGLVIPLSITDKPWCTAVHQSRSSRLKKAPTSMANSE